MTYQRDNLTDREHEILMCLVEGLSNKEIASQLHLAPSTVRWYNSIIYSKLGVNNRREAVSRVSTMVVLKKDQSSAPVKNNLPAETTPFIGRENELAELTQLFTNKQIRLITILALGGMGKTRLALKLAEKLAQFYKKEFIDGIFFVPLQSLTDPQHIISQIAAYIGYKLTGDGPEPEKQLLHYLSNKRLLLIMDNWEHLLAGTRIINELLEAAPELRILVTSREKLSISGETVFSLEGLNLPVWENANDAYQSEAVQLLVQSARRVKPDWRVDPSNLEYVKQICQITQGMPLGIILAASWLDTLLLRDIVEELLENIDFLESEMQDVPARQHSIRAIFNYSWKQLQPAEQQVFMKLSVFRGGFERNAAKVISNATSRVLKALVKKALIIPNYKGRFEIHELLHYYAEQRLKQDQSFESIHETHGQYFLEWLAGLEKDIKGERQVDALHEVENDFENIRKAWSHILKIKNFELIWDSSESLYLYCEMRSLFTEGEGLFDQGLKIVSGESANESIWSRLILCKHRIYETPEPSEERSRAIKIAEKTTNLEDIALGFLINGRSNWINQGNFDRALEFFLQAYDIFQQIDDKFYLAYTINRIGLCHAAKGNRRKGIELTEQSANLQRYIGDLSGLGISLNNLGAFHFLEGDYENSIRLLEESIAVSQRSKNSGNLVFAFGMLSLVYFSGAEFVEANKLALEANRMGHEIGYLQGASLGVSSLGLLSSVAEADYKKALQVSRQGMYLAKISNIELQTFSRCGIVIALCGLEDFDQLRVELRKLLKRTWLSLPIWGFICAALAVYCFRKQLYDQALRYLSFAMNSNNNIFQWAKQWPLLRQIETDLRSQFDHMKFKTLCYEGRNLLPAEFSQQILSDLA